jgi:hypothetical protein
MESLTRGIESSTRQRKATVTNCKVAAHKMLHTFHKERTLGTAALTSALAQGRGKLRSEDVAMRHDLHRAASTRRRWTKNLSTTVASMLTSFTKERAEETKAQHASLVTSRRKLSHDVASLMKQIGVAHREMAQVLGDSLHSYMRVARAQGAALHGSFMAPVLAPAMPHAAMAAGAPAEVVTHTRVVHDRGPDEHADRPKAKRK